ncbi:MAG: hypothetical protein M5R36_26230 [Deltaproteobacteria bacterium]|nr:hypothetical protein [Deltaproteobacteria bacterium]
MLIARLVFYALCLTVLVLAASAGSGCSGEYNLDDPPEFTATIEAAGDDDGDDDTSDDGGLAGPQTDDSFHVTVF